MPITAITARAWRLRSRRSSINCNESIISLSLIHIYAAQDAEAIFLVGDVFDFWFEYRGVVPKGFVRTLGKLAELTDRGIRVVFFTGNHDLSLIHIWPRHAAPAAGTMRRRSISSAPRPRSNMSAC